MEHYMEHEFIKECIGMGLTCNMKASIITSVFLTGSVIFGNYLGFYITRFAGLSLRLAWRLGVKF